MSAPVSELDRLVRKFIFDHLRDRAVPPVLEEIMLHFRLDRAAACEVLQRLDSARHLKLVSGTQRILMAFPFSAIATPFHVLANGRRYFANCAWDAVALHATLGTPIRIESRCHECAADLAIELADGRVVRATPPAPLVYIALPAAHWWDDIVNTCSNHMVFFLSREHLAAWEDSNPEAAGEDLTVETTHELGLPIYRDKMRLDYERPPKDQLLAHFASLGLAGDFWKL